MERMMGQRRSPRLTPEALHLCIVLQIQRQAPKARLRQQTGRPSGGGVAGKPSDAPPRDASRCSTPGQSKTLLQALGHYGGIDGRSVVPHDHDWQPVANGTPYTDHGERLAQCLADTLIDRLALCRSSLCGPLVQFIIDTERRHASPLFVFQAYAALALIVKWAVQATDVKVDT
jgi:hypothetical protein